MLLTISQPHKTALGDSAANEFSPRIPFYKPNVSTPVKTVSPVSSLRVSEGSEDRVMSTPHRGLPPPSAMTLPDPIRQPPSLSQPLRAMPNPPNQWQGQEESMRNWLAAKTEEDKRKQEEEKTRQESYRLEQRRIEQAILRESLQAGVPPSLVPLIYVGIGGANLANVSVDWLQQHAAQLQQTQQQVQEQASPEIRRETRMIQGPGAFAVAQPGPQQVLPSQPADPSQQGAPPQTTFTAYQPSQTRGTPTSVPRSTHAQLPKLTTNEMFIQQPPPSGPSSAHAIHQSQSHLQDQPTSSSSIHFHHWVPPGESKSTQPQTPASKGEPSSAHPGSHLSEEHRDSPRKRKAQGGHHANPPPSDRPQYTSPSFSAASSSSRRVGHGRTRSNTSVKDGDSKPESWREAEISRHARPESTRLSEERRSRNSPQHQEVPPSTEAASSRPEEPPPGSRQAERPQTGER